MRRSRLIASVIREGHSSRRNGEGATGAALANWHQRCTRGLTPDVDRTADPAVVQPKPKDAPEAVLDAAARALAAAVPLDDPQLALPASWRASAQWCVVMPSEASLAVAVACIVEAGLAREDLSFAQRLLLAPVLLFARSLARDQLRRVAYDRAAQACVAVAIAGRVVPASDIERLLQLLDVAIGPR